MRRSNPLIDRQITENKNYAIYLTVSKKRRRKSTENAYKSFCTPILFIGSVFIRVFPRPILKVSGD